MLEFFIFNETPYDINAHQLILHIQQLYQTDKIENPQVFVEEYEIVPPAEVITSKISKQLLWIMEFIRL